MISALFFGALAFQVPHAPSLRRASRNTPIFACTSWTESSTGLKYSDEKVGSGDEAKDGSLIKFNFQGRVVDGQDLDKGEGVQFELGKVDVVPGWDEGLKGMKTGGVRKVQIPPSLWSGAQPKVTKNIPSGAMVEFDFEMIECKTITLADRAEAGIKSRMTNQNLILGGLIALIGLYEVFLWVAGNSAAGDSMPGL